MPQPSSLLLFSVSLAPLSLSGIFIRAVDIKEKRFGFEPEITAKIAKMGVSC